MAGAQLGPSNCPRAYIDLFTMAEKVSEFATSVRHEVADVVVLRLEDEPTAPAVLPAVSHRDMRPRPGGVKLPEQRSLFLREGSWGASLSCGCQHPGGQTPGSGEWVNRCQAALIVVTNNKPKMLSGLNQNGLWSGPGARGSPGADGAPPAKSCDPPHPQYIGGTW